MISEEGPSDDYNTGHGKYSDSVQKICDLAQQLPEQMKVVGTAEDDQTALEASMRWSPDVVVINQDGSELMSIAKKIYVYKPHYHGRILKLQYECTGADIPD